MAKAKAKVTTATGKVGFITKAPANAIYVGFANGHPPKGKPINISSFGKRGLEIQELWLGDGTNPNEVFKAGLNLGLEFDENEFYPDWELKDDVYDQIQYEVEDFLKKNPSLKITRENFREYFDLLADNFSVVFNVFVLPVDFDASSLSDTFAVPDDALDETIKDMDREIKYQIKNAKSTGGKKGKAEQIIKQMKALQKQLNEFK